MKTFLLLTLLAATAYAEISMCIHNSEIFMEGEEFKDLCSTCTCGKGGAVTCDEKLCPPCIYMDPNGRSALARGPYNDGCNNCICTENGTPLCTEMYCPHKCQVTNDEGAFGWIGYDTTLELKSETEGCTKVCTCKHNTFWLGAALYECEDKC